MRWTVSGSGLCSVGLWPILRAEQRLFWGALLPVRMFRFLASVVTTRYLECKKQNRSSLFTDGKQPWFKGVGVGGEC